MCRKFNMLGKLYSRSNTKYCSKGCKINLKLRAYLCCLVGCSFKDMKLLQDQNAEPEDLEVMTKIPSHIEGDINKLSEFHFVSYGYINAEHAQVELDNDVYLGKITDVH